MEVNLQEGEMPKQDGSKGVIYPVLQPVVIKCADAGNAAGWSAVVLHGNVSGECHISWVHAPLRIT